MPWLEDACARKNNLYYEFVNVPTVENKAKYDKMNEFCAKHIDVAKLRYRKKYFDDYKDNSRKQWQMINELLNRRKSNIRVSKLIDENGKVSNTAINILRPYKHRISKAKLTIEAKSPQMSHLNSSYNSLWKTRYV